MRLIVAFMVLCFAAGYSSEEVVSTTEEKPVEVTTGDEGGNSEVAIIDSLFGMVDRACSCGKGKGGK